MGGGLCQLVAYGVQDVFLTGKIDESETKRGNPRIFYFKAVYRKYTNFSIESIIQTPSTTITKNTTNVSYIISRSGDLITKMWLKSYFPKVTTTTAGTTMSSWCNNTGHAYIKECEFLIGGSRIDKHNSMYLDINNEFTDVDEKEHFGLNKHQSNTYMKSGTSTIAPELQLYVPLKFYFNRNHGYALPLIALQYHEVEIKFKLRPLKNLLVSDQIIDAGNITDPTTELWVDYVFLDTEERTRFAQKSHEYLVEQVQIQHPEDFTTSIDLKFNHPVKQIIWVSTYNNRNNEIDITTNKANPSIFKPKLFDDSGALSLGTETVGGNDYFNYQVRSNTNTHNISGESSGSCIFMNKNVEHFDKMTIKFNSVERLTKQQAIYFRYLHPLNYNLRIPKKTIYTYNFALNPNEYQPSGTCNFSRIPQAILNFDNIGQSNDSTREIYIFAINYNILTIHSGMGGLTYAN